MYHALKNVTLLPAKKTRGAMGGMEFHVSGFKKYKKDFEQKLEPFSQNYVCKCDK